ncbi:adenosylcobinamide-phosphate synthase [Anaerosporobacter mobilis DSM 15930]|jgi:adenosylcobinamide-phosphate synthase|uniref:Cobalamin biosynthesis protein CobD n=2 Tax=Anaerosporobacter TaxID=653683 RepID=A0A1M7G379_9FIRM|nr:adenosylcobinamide-phosphate synthase CbiB [Anaerosporobacter mobilis]SHM10710.1 adenosylcobinamide-phosphate synthase [Anaerosporobacter mobilis DSM 15930]
MESMRYGIYACIIGFILDLIVGDPHWIYHPIRLIGKLISSTEKLIRHCFPKTKTGERIGGIVLAIIVMIISTGIPLVLLIICYKTNVYLGIIIEGIFCYQLLATKSLKVESMKVYKALKDKDIEKARYAVSMIVGRDTKSLDEVGITKAAVETVAENTSDGSIAPLIAIIIGGAPLGFLYKSINTMDSMIGYKNDKYIDIGRFAAKLDDVVNYIPARFSAYMMILSAYMLGMDGKNAYRIYKRDRYKHASPNSAHTESVCAGALRIRLAGDAYYFGKLHKKEYIGDALREIEIEDIKRANRLLYMCAFLSFVLLIGIKIGVSMAI